MEHIGAGLAALGVIGPGIGIGILAGLSATAIGRNPDAAGQIRGIAIPSVTRLTLRFDGLREQLVNFIESLSCLSTGRLCAL